MYLFIDSRGDGSSSENTSTSATGSPKSTPDVAMAESYSKPDKDPHFRKNIPSTAGKRDTWMRQRLLRQGSGDSDRGYRSDHEVYLAEKDQYGGQGYHDGYASDWEAFLAKHNYSAPPNEAMQNPQYVRTMPQGEVGYRGHAEGQEIKEGETYPYQWDTRFQYPDGASRVEGEYQARMTPPYEGYWQMVSSHFLIIHFFMHVLFKNSPFHLSVTHSKLAFQTKFSAMQGKKDFSNHVCKCHAHTFKNVSESFAS